MELKTIISHFIDIDEFLIIKPLESGLINSTFLVENVGEKYILQKINTQVFKNPEAIATNHQKINEILKNSNYSRKSAKIIFTKTGEYFSIDDLGNYWRMQEYFDDSLSYLKVPNPEIAFHSAKCFSEFYANLNQESNLTLKPVLPDFINFEKRINDYKTSLETASEERKILAKEEIKFINKNLSIPEKWMALEKANLLPKRIIHADPKISNILFNKNQEAIAVIDLDTIMNATLLYDFGDMIRSYTNLTDEDDATIPNNFSKEIYDAVKKGFLFHLKEMLTETESENLDEAPKVVIFIQALRFLTDFLNDDCYYSTKYENHNLDRTRNQLNLLKNIMFSEYNQL